MSTELKVTGEVNKDQIGSSDLNPIDWCEYLMRFISEVGNSGLTDGKTQFFGTVAKYVLEYVDEAEHQDGREYWDSFLSGEDSFEDFEIYVYNTRNEGK